MLRCVQAECADHDAMATWRRLSLDGSVRIAITARSSQPFGVGANGRSREIPAASPNGSTLA
jgi:hypothetical protein